MQQNTARTLAHGFSMAFDTISAIQTHVAKTIGDRTAFFGEPVKGIAGQFEIHALLKQQVSSFSYIGTLAILDSNGDLAGWSSSWPPEKINASSRRYFQSLKNDPQEIVAIGERDIDLASGEPVIVLARKIVNRDGLFIGVVTGAIPVDFFKREFAIVGPGPDIAAALLTRVGEPIVQKSSDGTIFEKRPDDSTQRHASVVSFADPGDGAARLVGLHELENYPLSVAVSQTYASALSRWRTQSLLVSLFVALVDTALIAFCYVSYRQGRAMARLASMEGRLARYDAMTGLANRIRFDETIRKLSKGQDDFSLFTLDLNLFKNVNDRFGHVIGDAVLKQLTVRLHRCVGPDDFIARLDGDEFAVIRMGDCDRASAQAFAERLIDVLTRPYDINGIRITLGISIGVVNTLDHGRDPDRLQSRVDLALYAVKDDGHQSIMFFDEALEKEASARRQLESDLRRAVRDNEFELYYQPILNIGSNRVAGFEALLRWRHPERGIVSPDAFIPAAEAIGLIVPLGEWVLHEACRAAAQWPVAVTVAVNLSPVQFESQDIYKVVVGALEKAGLPASRLEVEITESALLEAKEADAALHKLKEIGVAIALDDFGTGYASLAYLRRLPFKKLKIDKSFVRDMRASAESENIVRTVLELARRLDLTTVAEGVETEEHLAALREAGCMQAQGYLTGRPMPGSDVGAFLLNRSLRPSAPSSTAMEGASPSTEGLET
ncbi:diguanylate cyclase (GGDEF)-like protein [Microvirga flocculans]|uniref:Diguanylate cyclase (GGDEF)-like protein n=1 Tax=Microvirga flocculans TaxID=217168 RepID=A0A7W6N7H6_9HYPH|nr:EAL domain-containing protein [Microvirga flocculans]MBB4040123.1 diguanylate cyclase (GGDEF)-like protein [Microvirga flocculans]